MKPHLPLTQSCRTRVPIGSQAGRRWKKPEPGRLRRLRKLRRQPEPVSKLTRQSEPRLERNFQTKSILEGKE